MTDRVIIQSTGASPLRVSVPGASAATAEFDNLIFDGNQSPLRLSQNGYMSVGLITDSAFTAPSPQNIAETTGPAILTSPPSGMTPLFMTVYRQPYQFRASGNSTGPITQAPNVVRTPAFFPGLGIGGTGERGGGGAICGGFFIGVTFTPHTFATSEGIDRNLPTLVNYAIFKNYM